MASGMHRMGVVALMQAYASGRVSVAAAVDHYLDRIARLDPAIGAFTYVDGNSARAAAQASAARWDAGTARPLEGVPIAIKANIDVKGWPVTGGVGALSDRIAPTDAAVTTRLRHSGAVIIGLTNMHEAALGATTDNPFFGRTHNPHRIGHTAGGSSGGSGAAVSAGLCAAALGTDTLGSVRIPAAYCGVTGLKPTNGLVDISGVMPLVARWDCVGPLARCVDDIAAMMAVMAPLSEAGPIHRVARLTATRYPEADPAVAAALRLAGDLLSGLGVSVEERTVAIDRHQVRIAAFAAAASEAGRRFATDMAAGPTGFSATFRSHIDLAASVGAAAHAAGEASLVAATTELRALLSAVDAVLLPATPQPAFAHGTPAPANQADFTLLANVAGLPALSLPAGWTSDGLPVAVQLVGRSGADSALIALGAKLEAALNAWRPPVEFA